jgi:DUF1365 family protein
VSRDLPPLPALAIGTVRHTRRTPLRNSFTHRHYQWLVDLDALPGLGILRPLARFEPRDHLDGGRRGGGIAGDLRRLLAAHGRPVRPDERLLMLAHARVLGHVFNSLTVYWLVRPDGGSDVAVLEVHNTYGGRQAYLLHPDRAGRARTAKRMYVSPFNAVEGEYAVRLHLCPEAVRIAAGLDVRGERVLTATARARLVPATRRRVLGTALRHLPMPLREAALIRLHGVALWLRGLRVQPRLDCERGRCPVAVDVSPDEPATPTQLPGHAEVLP